MEWARTDLDVPNRLAIISIGRRDLAGLGFNLNLFRESDPVEIARWAELLIERCRPDLRGVVITSIRQNLERWELEFIAHHASFKPVLPGDQLRRIVLEAPPFITAEMVKESAADLTGLQRSDVVTELTKPIVNEDESMTPTREVAIRFEDYHGQEHWVIYVDGQKLPKLPNNGYMRFEYAVQALGFVRTAQPLGFRAVRPLPACGMPSHHADCDCGGVAGDR